MNTILLIGTPFDMTHWRSFIQSWKSHLCQDRRICGTNFFPLLSRWSNIVRKYCLGGWCGRRGWDCQWGIKVCPFLFLLRKRSLWCQLTRLPPFIWGRIPLVSGSRCPIPDTPCVWQGDLTLLVLWSDRASSQVSGYEVWSGRNMVWITSNGVFLDRSTQV